MMEFNEKRSLWKRLKEVLLPKDAVFKRIVIDEGEDKDKFTFVLIPFTDFASAIIFADTRLRGYSAAILSGKEIKESFKRGEK